MATTYLNTFARNYLPTAVYNRLPDTSFWRQAAKFGKIVPIACLAWNYSTTGQVATLGNLGLLVMGGLLHYLSQTPTLFRKFTALPVSVASQVVSFLAYKDLCNFSAASKGSQALRNRKDYRLDREYLTRLARLGRYFNEDCYRREWQVEVIAQVSNKGVRDCLNVYYGEPDLFKRRGKIGDYCLAIFLEPTKVKDTGSIDYEDYCLNKLGELAKRSKNHPAGYTYDQTRALEQHGKNPSERASLVMKMDRVIGRRLTWQEKVQALQRLRAGWRTPPTLLSQTGVLLAHHALTGERYHGNERGKEGTWTFGRASETVQDGDGIKQTGSGFFKEPKEGEADGSSRSKLYVHFNDYDEFHVVGVQRKFY